MSWLMRCFFVWCLSLCAMCLATVCNPSQRSYFNGNLLGFLRSWHARDPALHRPEGFTPHPEPSAEPRISTPAKELVYWAFDKLDVQPYDRQLQPSEVRAFGEGMVRDVGPRACAENFIEYCDANGDERISLHEWCDCTGYERPPEVQGAWMLKWLSSHTGTSHLTPLDSPWNIFIFSAWSCSTCVLHPSHLSTSVLSSWLLC